MKSFNSYEVYVFDVDGTLYDQPRLRTIMAVRLLQYYLFHPLKIKDLLLLKKFREEKENWTKEKEIETEAFTGTECGLSLLDEKICFYISHKIKVSHDIICGIVKKWIYDEPMDAVNITRDKRLIDYIDTLSKKGKKIIIFSDYPATDKMKALECYSDAIYSAADKEIMELKPSPKGINVIIRDLNVSKENVLMIGDRYEKDGMSAINAGVDYIILKRKLKDRADFYKENLV